MNTETVKVCGILLAAGESRRMGGVNKLQLSVDGMPLLRRTAGILLASRLAHLLVVTGYQADIARALLDDLAINIVHNDNYTEGQMSSVYKGIAALSEECDGIMICLADQPLLETEDINYLIDAYENLKHGSILVPTYEGRRGNPIILAQQHCDAILAGERNLGCKRLIEKHPDWVETLEMPNNHVIVDLDTPSDYAIIAEEREKVKEKREQRRALN